MARYTVTWEEIVTYVATVEAENEHDARMLWASGDYYFGGDNVDSEILYNSATVELLDDEA